MPIAKTWFNCQFLLEKKTAFHFKNLSTNQSAALLAIATPPLFSPCSFTTGSHFRLPVVEADPNPKPQTKGTSPSAPLIL